MRYCIRDLLTNMCLQVNMFLSRMQTSTYSRLNKKLWLEYEEYNKSHEVQFQQLLVNITCLDACSIQH